jgi:hypothetical protein
MNTVIPTHTTEPNGPSGIWQLPREVCPSASEDKGRKQEADRLFEARLQWFLSVSRAA